MIDEKFLQFMKECAKSYNITIKENVPEGQGGIFWHYSDGTTRKLSDKEFEAILKDTE